MPEPRTECDWCGRESDRITELSDDLETANLCEDCAREWHYAEDSAELPDPNPEPFHRPPGTWM